MQKNLYKNLFLTFSIVAIRSIEKVGMQLEKVSKIIPLFFTQANLLKPCKGSLLPVLKNFANPVTKKLINIY